MSADPLLAYLQQLQPDRVVLLDDGQRRCRVCHCTQDHACVDPVHGPCWWVEVDLCSHCGEPAIVADEFDRKKHDVNFADSIDIVRWCLRARASLGRCASSDPAIFEVGPRS